MDSNINEQSLSDLLHAMINDENQSTNAAFDIIKNEVIPSLNQAEESMNRANEQFQNAHDIRVSRLDLLYKNENNLGCNYFSPKCDAVKKKVLKYYQFVYEEINNLELLLNEASTSTKNMLAFQSLWDSYEKQLITCVHNNNQTITPTPANTPMQRTPEEHTSQD